MNVSFSSQLLVDMDAEFNMDFGIFGYTDQDRFTCFRLSNCHNFV